MVWYSTVWFVWLLGGQAREVTENCDVLNFLSSLLSWSEQGDDKTKGCGFDPHRDHSLDTCGSLLTQNTLWFCDYPSLTLPLSLKEANKWLLKGSLHFFSKLFLMSPCCHLGVWQLLRARQRNAGCRAQWTPARLLPHLNMGSAATNGGKAPGKSVCCTELLFALPVYQCALWLMEDWPWLM